MIPHFELVRGKERFLLFRTEEEFHIIDCDEALTKEKRFAILESGCTPAEMQEMGLSGTTIAKSDLSAVTVTGCGPQDDVIFYLGKKQLSYRFAAAYEQRRVDDFFRGIPRKQYKTRRRFKGGRDLDWRLKAQDDEMYQRLRTMGWVYNILCVVIGLIPFVHVEVRVVPFGWTVLGMCLVAVGLDVFLPEYFSILFFEDKEDRRKKRGGGRRILKTRAIRLGYGMVCLLMVFLLFGHRYNVVWNVQYLKVTIFLTLAVFAVLIFLCREFGELLKANPLLLVTHMIFALALNGLMLVPHFNHALGGDLTPFTAVIIDQHISGGRSESYYCTINLPDGKELDIQVTRDKYESCEIGDTMDLQYGTGFFGIEYAIDE